MIILAIAGIIVVLVLIVLEKRKFYFPVPSDLKAMLVIAHPDDETMFFCKVFKKINILSLGFLGQQFSILLGKMWKFFSFL